MPVADPAWVLPPVSPARKPPAPPAPAPRPPWGSLTGLGSRWSRFWSLLLSSRGTLRPSGPVLVTGAPGPHRRPRPLGGRSSIGAGQEASRVSAAPIRMCSPSLVPLPRYPSDLPTLSPGQTRLIIHLISQAQKVASKWPKYLDHSTTSELISVVLKADAEATWLLFPAVCCQHS